MNPSLRWQTIVPEDVTLREIYLYAITQGYTECTFLKFKKDYRNKKNIYGHLNRNIHKVVMGTHRTFGSYEPTYLELLGSAEVLRFMGLSEPRCLLLGSLGHYSAVEFGTFLRKLNNSAHVYVIDEWDRSVKIISEETDRNEIVLVRGDATQLPFKDGLFTHVYTNYLFHALGRMTSTHRYVHMLGHKVFFEAARVLEPGGSFLLVESPERMLRDKMSTLRFGYRQAALKCGLRPAGTRLRPINYILTPEKMTAEITPDGYGRCNALFEQYKVDAAYRFVK